MGTTTARDGSRGTSGRKTAPRWFGALAACALLVACAHDEPPTARVPAARGAEDVATARSAVGTTMGVTNAQPRSVDPVDPATLTLLASARCDREDACGDVGDARRYASRSACMDQVRTGILSDIEAYGCAGMGESAVRQCLVAMRRQDCGAPGEQALTHVEECALSDLCTPFGGE